MRVTEHTNYNLIRDNIQKSRGRMETLQQESATLKKLNTPSDDPVGASKVLEVRTDKVNNDQFQMNGKIAETFLNNSDHALSELADIVVRAKEIALGQSSGASSNEDSRIGVAEEVTQLYQQAVATANRRIGDRYLFGGYKTQTAPVDGEGKYVGDDGKMMVEIAKDVFISMNVPGIEAFNTQPKTILENKEGYKDGYTVRRSPASEDPAAEQRKNSLENVNVFDQLQDLRISLLTGDIEGIRNTLERFDQLHSSLVATRARVGSRIQGIQSTGQALERHNLTNATLTSNLEDADMAQVVSDLTKEETVFKSALASSQKLIQPTLLDFLK